MNLNAIDRAKPQKLYYQLLEVLRGHIEKGEWMVGKQIPTEEQLCSQYSVSKATVRLAIEELASLGYLKKFQGKGTFVRRRMPDSSGSMLVNLWEEDIRYDSSCIIRVIENKIVQAGGNIKDCLELSDENHCFFLSRLTIADSKPQIIQKLYVSYSFMHGFINGEELRSISFNALLEDKIGIRIQRVKEIADISHISEKDATLLELSPNLPVLRIQHKCYAHDDMPISFSESFYRTDTYPRTLEFERLRI